MNERRIILRILAATILLAGCPWIAAQQPPLAPQPLPPSAAPAASGPPYFDQQPIIVQPQPVAPVYPPQSTVVPLPSHAPGSIFGPPASAAAAAPGQPLAPAGPEQLPPPPGAGAAQPILVGPGLPGQVVVTAPPSTIVVPVIDDDLAWDQLVDVVSDFFKVAREQRARRGGDAWCEGRIETAPLDGATWLEPHRRDSVGSFNRWESTFQSIRRRAIIRVVPEANGYLVEVTVEKELEDLPTPEKATAGVAAFRNDQSLPSRRLEEVSRLRSSPRWIALGRDPPLEQLMLAEIHARLNGITAGGGTVFAR
jgi:hypothetical protein